MARKPSKSGDLRVLAFSQKTCLKLGEMFQHVFIPKYVSWDHHAMFAIANQTNRPSLP